MLARFTQFKFSLSNFAAFLSSGMTGVIKYSIISYAFIFSMLNAQDYTVRSIAINSNGESHKDRNVIQVDGDGFLWYSTYNGIVKDFETHSVLSSLADENGKNPPKIIFAIFMDSKERIWVSATTGIFVSEEGLHTSFNRIKFKPFLKGEDLSGNSFIEDCDGNIWIVGSDNLVLKVDSSFAVETYQIPEIKPKYALTDYYKREFLFFEKMIGCDKILSRQGRKLFVLEKGRATLIADFTPSKNYEKTEYLNPEWTFNGGDGLLISPNGELLPKSTDGHYTYEGEIFKTYFIEDLDIQVLNLPLQEMIPISAKDNPILTKYADLIGIDDFGKKLTLYKMMEIKGDLHLKKTTEIPFPNLIDDLAIGKNDIIYVCSYDRIDKIKFSKNSFDKILDHYGKRSISARGLLELPHGEMLAATYSGVFKLTPSNDRYSENAYGTENVFPSLNFLRSFIKTTDSTAWCLGENRALMEINFPKKKIIGQYIFEKDWKLGQLRYYDILQSSDTTLMLASNFGLQEFNTQQKEFRELPIPSVANNRELFVRDIHRAGDRLFIGTDANGLFVQDLDSDAFLHLNNDPTKGGSALPTNKIYSIFVDGQENIWLGTDKGAVHVDKDLKKQVLIDGSDGLTNLNVVGVLEDANENMWFSTYNGLYRYEKSSKKVTAFYVEDGLISNDFNQNSYYRTSTDKLFFGGVRGLIAFDSIDDTIRSQEIRIFPTRFEYYDMEAEKDVELDVLDKGPYKFGLAHNKNSFSVSYTINDCYNTSTNKYAYRLDGFTDDWVDLGNQTTLKLLSIPPGDYVLRIKGLNSTGIESSNELRYDMHVTEVFYKRPWVQALAVLLLLGLVVLALSNHASRERKKRKLHLTVIELERKTLRAQMNPHFIFNALNGIRKTVKEGKLAKLDEYITNFSTLMRLTLDLTRNENIQLAKELRYINNYVALTNTKSGNKINLVVECDPNIDTQATYVPSMLLQPIVENSIVHGFAEDERVKTITLKMERSTATKQLILTVTDDGIGISQAKKNNLIYPEHQSYATQILNERLRLLNQISKNSSGYGISMKDIGDGTKRGTEVIIKIPY